MAWLKIKGALGQKALLEGRDTSSLAESLSSSRSRRRLLSPAALDALDIEDQYASIRTRTDAGDVSTAPDDYLLEEDDPAAALQPEVIVISPKKGPVTGDTRLTIRGDYLGTDASDIVSLTVCGRDCLASLEYESPTTVHCTTVPGEPGTGPVTLETAAGGWAVSLATFTYVDVPHEQPKRQISRNSSEGHKRKQSKKASKISDAQLGPLDSGSPKKMLWEELGRVQQENADLKRENDSMRAYIEQLLPKVLALCPEALCWNDTDAESLSVANPNA